MDTKTLQTDATPMYGRMTARELYRFDVQGFLVVPNALDAAEVARINEAVDANPQHLHVRKPEYEDSKTLTGHDGLAASGMLEWEKPWCDPFRDIVVHPRVIGYLNTLLGRGWHLDHGPTWFQSPQGACGHAFHLGEYFWVDGAYYIYKAGQIRSGLTVLQWVLADQGGELGGFACIPGSHKANFPRPREISLWHEDQDMIACPEVKAGDLIIFSEATTHGALPWKGEHDRRALLLRYAPRHVQYGPGFHSYELPDWLSEVDERTRAVFEPAYIYNRPVVNEDGSVERPFWDLEPPPFPYSKPQA